MLNNKQLKSLILKLTRDVISLKVRKYYANIILKLIKKGASVCIVDVIDDIHLISWCEKKMTFFTVDKEEIFLSEEAVINKIMMAKRIY